MLTARILTAGLLVPLVVAGVLYMPTRVMAMIFAGIVFLGAMEWALLAGCASLPAKLAYAAATVGAAVVVRELSRGHPATSIVLVLACLWWVAALLWVVSYQINESPRPQSRLLVAALGWLVLIPAWISVTLLLELDPAMLLVLFVCVWCADILAYFGGKLLGRRRLASHVSPGKTWEGLIVALLGTVLLAAMLGSQLDLVSTNVAVTVLVVTATVLASVVGDLFESLLKRVRGLKHSGSLLPGHGGMLDRIDGMLAAAPVFAVGYMNLGH